MIIIIVIYIMIVISIIIIIIVIVIITGYRTRLGPTSAALYHSAPFGSSQRGV